MDNRPQGREKNITGTGQGIKKRGDGQGTGHVGGGGGIPSSDDSAMVSPICPPPDPRILVATAA